MPSIGRPVLGLVFAWVTESRPTALASVAFRVLEDGRKVRVAKANGNVIES